MRKLWEYKTETFENNRQLSRASLDLLGIEGWEMCGVISRGHVHKYFFKRVMP